MHNYIRLGFSQIRMKRLQMFKITSVQGLSSLTVLTLSPFRPEFFFSGFNFTTAYVVCITAVINRVFISFFTIQL